jgi:hypothetical protein
MVSIGAQIDALKQLWENHGYDALNAEERLRQIDEESSHNFRDYYRTVSEYAYAENYAISYLIRGYGAFLDDSITDWEIVQEHEKEMDEYNKMNRHQKLKYNKEDKEQGSPMKKHFKAERIRTRKIIERAMAQYTRVKKELFGPESTWGEIVISESFPDLTLRFPATMLRPRCQHRTLEEREATSQKKKDNAAAKIANIVAPLVDIATPAAPLVDTVSSAAPLVDIATPAAPLVDIATPAAPLVDIATPAAPLVDIATPAAPLVDIATPAAPLVNTVSPAADITTSAVRPVDQLYSHPSSQIDIQMDDTDYIDLKDIISCRKRKVIHLQIFSDANYNSILEFINNLK